jgi:hypothetical protein
MFSLALKGASTDVARIGRLVSGAERCRTTAPSLTLGPLPCRSKKTTYRRHIPKQQHRVTNGAAYDAALHQRGSFTVWFTDAAIAAWRAEPRTSRGGQPCYAALAITTALTLRAVFGLAQRQAEGLIGSTIGLLGLGLPAPDHTTSSRRAETLEVPRPRSDGDSKPVRLWVDGTGLKLCGLGEWRVEKHGRRTRRSWRKLHIGVDADTDRIIASELTTNDVNDGSRIGPLLDQIGTPVASFTADGAFDRDDIYTEIYTEVATRHPGVEVIVPPRSNAAPNQTVETRQRRAIAISRPSPSTAAWLGRKPLATIGALWSRPIFRARSASLAMGSVRKRMGVRRRRPSPSAC